MIPDKYNTNGRLEKAVVEALTLAGTAVDVLSNNFNDPKVQSMVKHILDDGQQFQAKVEIAKGE